MVKKMDINIPEVIEEVTLAFFAYEKALAENNVERINQFFWEDSKTIRYGPNGTLIGYVALSEFRRNRKITGVRRALKNTSILAFGRDFAVANTEAEVDNMPGTTQQSQTWIRTEKGWKIVSAHVSHI